MSDASKVHLSILLACPPGLAQVSLITAVNAFPWATVVAKAKDVDSALAMAAGLAPDVFLTAPYFLGDLASGFLRRVHEIDSRMLLVVLAGSTLRKTHFLDQGAHLVLDYNDLTRQFSQVLTLAQSRVDRYE